LRKYLECIGSFEHLCKYFKLLAITAVEVEQFVYKLYGAENSNIDYIRYTLFCSPSKRTQCSLPPRKNELNLHVKRANYQAVIWRRVKTAYIDAPPPEHYGWIVENHSSIIIKRMTQASAPEHVYCRV